MLISQAFELYRRDVISFRNQSHKTEEHHLVALKSIINFCGDIPLEQLDFEVVRQWKLSLEKRHLANETVRGYLVRLRCVLAHQRVRGEFCLDPARVPLPKRVQRVPNFLTSEQVSLLIDSTGSLSAKAIISLLYASGIRVSELCGLNRGDLRPDKTFTVVGKGSKARICFMDARAADYIAKYLATRTDGNEALFISRLSKKRVTPSNIQEIFKHLRKKMGYKDTISPHWLRHSFATNLAQNDAHILTISRLMGHASVETTSVYLHISDQRLQEEYQRHHSI